MKQGCLTVLLVAALVGLIGIGCAKVKEPPLDLLSGVEDPVSPTDAESLVVALDQCDQLHAGMIDGEGDLYALEGAAMRRGFCFHRAADTSILALDEAAAPNISDFPSELTAALEDYRTTHRDLCEFIVLGSDNPWGVEGQVASAECEAEAELKAARLMASWGFRFVGDSKVEIEVEKRHAPCYVAYNQALDVADSQLRAQEAQLTLWACVADIARANRKAVLDAAKANVNGFDARYVEEDFETVLEATDETKGALCSLFVEASGEPQAAWTAFDRASCGTDAEALRDDLFVKAAGR